MTKIVTRSAESPQALLEELWACHGVSEIQKSKDGKCITILCEKAIMIPPKSWRRVYLPYKLTIRGSVNVLYGLQSNNCVVGIPMTKSGHIRVNA